MQFKGFLYCLLFMLTGTIVADTAPALPNIVTCKPTNGKDKDYIAIALKCDAEGKQAACDRYANTPGYGPAKPTECTSFKTKDELVAYIKSHRFPGLGGFATMCQSRADKNIKFAVGTLSCSKEDQATACDTELGFADPISCDRHGPSNVELNAFLDANPKTHGIECKLKLGGIAFRALVPDCSDKVKNEICKPKDSTLMSCKYLGKDPKVLKEYAKELINEAMVTCRIRQTGTEYRRPTANCDKDTQRSACPPSADPVKCDQYKSVKEIAVSYAK